MIAKAVSILCTVVLISCVKTVYLPQDAAAYKLRLDAVEQELASCQERQAEIDNAWDSVRQELDNYRDLCR